MTTRVQTPRRNRSRGERPDRVRENAVLRRSALDRRAEAGAASTSRPRPRARARSRTPTRPGRTSRRIPRHEPDERRSSRHSSRSPAMTDQSLEIPASPSPEGAPQPAAAETAPAAGAQAATGTLVLEPPAPVEAVPSTKAEESVPISAADKAKLDAMVASYLDAVSSLDPHSQAFADKVKDIGKLGDDDIRASAVGLEPAAREAHRGDAERRPDRDLGGQQVAPQPAPPGRGPRPGQAGRPVQPARRSSACCRSAPATGSATTSTSTARASTRSTRSSRRSTTARTSSSATTPRSSRRRSTSGRRWAGCASTPTSPGASTTR